MRNAGGVVTDDMIRSLMLAQRLKGTVATVLVHHTDCALQRVDGNAVRADVQREAGTKLPFDLEDFKDLDADVRKSMARIYASPFLRHKMEVRGYVFDVDTHTLRRVRGPELDLESPDGDRALSA